VKIGSIVEGHGEEEAAPILLRRIVAYLDPSLHVETARPHRLSRGQLVTAPELQRAVELVARRSQPGDAILILLDADADPACRLGPQLLRWAVQQRPDRRIGVVLAVQELEAWFLAAASSLAGRRTLPPDLADVADPEARRSPTGWLNERMRHGYSETLDQPALAQLLDVPRARRADSFDKLVREIARLVDRSCPPR
jgi:hypothetical protein